MFTPLRIAYDYETALLSGEPSIEYWRPDFRVTSTAFAWRSSDNSIKTKFCKGEEETREFLKQVQDIPLICHNFSFEGGVNMFRFPDLPLNVQIDTIRLALVADGGGSEVEKYGKKQDVDSLIEQLEGTYKSDYGLGLVKCCNRWLGTEHQNHKDEAHDWLRANGVKAGKEGENLHLLPDNIFERYNIADAVNTLLLAEAFEEFFKGINYDWTFDHQLYLRKCKLIARSKGEGCNVNREALQYVHDLRESQSQDIVNKIREIHPKEVALVERKIREDLINTRKTLKGKKNVLRTEKAKGKTIFSLGSGKQKEYLFCKLLGFETPFKTPKGRPSFKKTHVHVYGEAGEVMRKKGTLDLTKNQAKNMLLMSETDGRVHISLNPCGTATGRSSGSVFRD